MHKFLFSFCFIILGLSLSAQDSVGPIFKDGEAQIVPEFEIEEDWIRHDLWVETEFDTDGDGEMDRMHVDVTRPKQTEDGLKLPVIYATSPYYAGTQAFIPGGFWNVRHELGEIGPERASAQVVRRRERPIISNSEIKLERFS